MTDNLLDDRPAEIKPEEFIGEGKKWKDTPTLIKAKNDSDAYVKVLESRIDDLREDYLKLRENQTTRAQLEEMLRQAEEAKAGLPPQSPSSPTPTTQPDIESVVDRKIEQREKLRQEQTNFNTVRDKLKEHFGDDFAPHVRKRIADLGLTEQTFNDFARNSPSATLAMLVPNKQETYQAPLQTSGALRQANAPKRTWSYYQDLKKSNPRLYLDPKIATQMHNDALALGNSFYDGDFGEYSPVG